MSRDGGQDPDTPARSGTPPADIDRPVLSPGQQLGGRYRIVKFLARGGAGEVYQAIDEELETPIALKLLSRDGDRRTQERFKREVHLARRVTHPNVCRIYELVHDDGDGPEQSRTCLTMELLEGETLAERLERGPRFSSAEALTVARQIAAGLDAAHAAGVVHRDLKPQNVLLVAGADPGQVRAVITDFGVARGVADDHFAARVTGGVVGSPAYMAPEQLAGEEVGVATDVYAFGLVLYEMVTCVHAFRADDAIHEVVRRLRAPPVSPRTHAPELDPRWEAAIMRCLEREPDRRFASAQAVIEAVEGGRPARRPRLTILLVAALAVLLGFAGALLHGSSSAGDQPRPVVAVLGFEGQSGASAAGWISGALAEMIRLELGAGDRVRGISGDEVARMKVDLALADADPQPIERIAQIRTVTAADQVVCGSYRVSPDGATVTVNVRLQDGRTGATTAAFVEEGPEAELRALAARAGARLRQELGVSTSAPGEGEPQAGLPPDPAALRLYVLGQEKLRNLDPVGARDLLLQAAGKDGESPLLQAALSSAWWAMGHDDKAEEAARRALGRSGSLPRPQRLRVEARMHEITGQWSKAVDIHRALQILSPDDIEVTIGLITALSGSGRAAEAIEVLAEARRLSPHWQGDVRLDLAESFASRELGDYTRMQAVAARAVATGRARGQRHLVAQARRLEGQAYGWLGRLAEARSAHAEARRFYLEVGDRRGVAIAWNDEGLIDLAQGRLDEAERKWREALSIGRAMGDRDAVALAKNNLTLVLERRGDDAGVRAYLEEALATWEETGRDARVLLAVGNLAVLHMRTGNLSEARRLGERALAAARQRGLRKEEFLALRLLMDVEIASGHLPQARDLASQVDRSMGAAPAADDRANALDGRARLDDITGAPDQAARRMEAAIASLVGSGADPDHQAYARLRQAQHLQVAGQASRAERSLREAIPVLAAQKQTLLESVARATLALCRLDQGDLPAARSEIAGAVRLLEGAETRYLERLEVALARAKVTAAAGQRDEARRQLASIVREADQIGVVPLRLEATLALGTIERRAGRTRLRTLAEEAERLGFLRIARAAAGRAR